MGDVGQTAVIFGASGGIGRALCTEAKTRGYEKILAGARDKTALSELDGDLFSFDFSDEASIAAVADKMKDPPPDLVIMATGVLTLPDGTGPEKTLKALDAEAMAEVLRINTIGPAMIAKHILPIMPRDRRSVFAALSARVGSISDNRLGGWHSYRASKAALNMLLRNFAIEMKRTHKQAIVCGLHPGTVDTSLSEPFQGNVPDEQLFSPEKSAGHLMDVIDGLTPEDSGDVFAWDGERIPA